MAFNDELKVYASEGRVQPYCQVGEFHLALSDEASVLTGEELDAIIRKTYGEDMANRIRCEVENCFLSSSITLRFMSSNNH